MEQSSARNSALQVLAAGDDRRELQGHDGRSAFAKLRDRICEKERFAKLNLVSLCGRSGWWGTGLRRRRTGKQSVSASGHAGEPGYDHDD